MRDILSQICEIFDYPSGQRLRPIFKVEVQRLKKMGALKISDTVAVKLNTISSATIYRLFYPIKEGSRYERRSSRRNLSCLVK